MAKKIIIWVCIGLIIIVGGSSIILAVVSVDYKPTYADPDAILVYKNGDQSAYPNVLRADQSDGDVCYSSIFDTLRDSFKQKAFSALFNGTLGDDYIVENVGNSSLDFSKGTWIVYYYANYHNEKQFVRDSKDNIIDDQLYTNILINVSYSEKDVDIITFYLGSASGTTFNYSYVYKAYGNINELAILLNK